MVKKYWNLNLIEIKVKFASATDSKEEKDSRRVIVDKIVKAIGSVSLSK